MPAISLTSKQFHLTVAVYVRQFEYMNLRKRFIDGVLFPFEIGAATALLHPIHAITVAAPVNQIHFAVVVHVVADDRKTGFPEIPIGMPVPFVLICVHILEPAMRRQ